MCSSRSVVWATMIARFAQEPGKALGCSLLKKANVMASFVSARPKKLKGAFFMLKHIMYSTLALDLVFGRRLASAADASSLTQIAFNILKIKKRSILGKIVQENSTSR